MDLKWYFSYTSILKASLWWYVFVRLLINLFGFVHVWVHADMDQNIQYMEEKKPKYENARFQVPPEIRICCIVVKMLGF